MDNSDSSTESTDFHRHFSRATKDRERDDRLRLQDPIPVSLRGLGWNEDMDTDLDGPAALMERELVRCIQKKVMLSSDG